MGKKKRIVFLLAGALLLVVAVAAVSLYRNSDWKAPTLTVVESYEVDYGQPVYLYQLIKQADDRSNFNLSMTGDGALDEQEKTITFQRPGQYPVEITAVDSHGNKTVKTATVQVVDRVAPVIQAEELTVYVGEEADYAAQVTATDEIDGDLTQSVKINSSKVDLERPGRYEIIYTVEDRSGNSASYSSHVTVQQEQASEVNLNRTELYLAGNEYEQLEVEITPDDWEGKVVWSSSDPTVATVSGGLVVWAGEGSCTITAAADDVSAECAVVCSAAAASEVWLSKHTLKLEKNGSDTLTATVFPSNWSGEVTWKSSNPTVAAVQDGKVTWVGGGICTITAAADGWSDSCIVTCEGGTIENILNGLLGTNRGNDTAASQQSGAQANNENKSDHEKHD